MRTILIAGASGLVGSAAVEHFLSLPDWQVIAVSRRKPLENSRLHHIPLDLKDQNACRKAFSEITVSHIVYAALFEKPGLIAGWQDQEQMQTNLRMLQNLLNPLLTDSLQHISLLQGTKAYGAHLHPIPIPAREDAKRDPHENFYWLQEDYIREKAKEYGFNFTVLRPPLVVGGSWGVAMNIIPVIGLFASICKEEGLPLCFPGGSSLLLDTADSRLLAKVFVWAATNKNAKNEIFNVTNGDVTEWRTLWPTLAEVFKMEAGPDRPCELKTFLPSKTQFWNKITKKYGLKSLSMNELLGESHHYADLIFGYGIKESISPALLSTIKIREAGFQDCIDTRLTYTYWLQYLMKKNILPKSSI